MHFKKTVNLNHSPFIWKALTIPGIEQVQRFVEMDANLWPISRARLLSVYKNLLLKKLSHKHRLFL